MESDERPIMPADLYMAAIQGNYQFLVRHLGLSAEVQSHIEEEDERVHDKLKSATLFGDTVLHVLIANGHNDLSLKVIHKDASLLKAKNKKSETPLHCAIRVGNRDIIQNLIQLSPEVVYQVNNEGLTPLHLAIAEGQVAVAEYMLHIDNSLACAQFSDGTFPVHAAACMKNTKLLEHLLDKYPYYVGLKDSLGRNFFHIAAEENKTEIFTEVFKNKNNTIMNGMINAKDNNGNTPLHIAAKKGNNIIMEAIWEYLPADAVTNERNNEGLTPFDFSEIQLKSTFKRIERRINDHIKLSGRKFTIDWFDTIMEPPTENVWEKSQLIGLGSVLITTVAFAAAFTVPGGYNSDHGTPIIGRRYMFRAFIFANALAFVQAFISVFFLVFNGTTGILDVDDLRFASFMFVSAANCMVLSFGTGSYVMLAPINMPMSIVILVVALLFGSPTVFIIYSTTRGFWKALNKRDSNNGKVLLSVLIVWYALPFVFIFCLAFLK